MVVLRKLQAFGWVRTSLLTGLLATLAMSGGCETAAGTGAAAGGLLGAGAGALLGRGPGAMLAGAAIGAGAGTLTGAGVDIARDKKAQRAANAQAAQVAARAPSLDDIVSMTQNAVPTAQIVEQVRTSGAVYRLSANDVINLNRQGVDKSVVAALQDSALQPPVGRVAYTAAPVVVEQPVYVGGPVVGYGYGYGWRRGYYR